MALDALTRAARKIKLGQLGSAADLPFNLRVLIEAGVVGPMKPTELVAVGGALRRWGASPAAGITASAIRRGDEVGLIDERGSVTFSELDRNSNALARALRSEGVHEGDSVALMCRNHRGFVDALFACAKLGTTVLLMNTDFAGPQLEGVVEREGPRAVIYDAEFTELLEQAGEGLVRVVSWTDEDEAVDEVTAGELIAASSTGALDPPHGSSRFVILTSGTTGTPKGARRSSPDSLGPLAVLLSKIPLRSEQSMHIAAPLFHSWGFMHFNLGLALGTTYILRRRFTPEGVLQAASEHQADALAVVPVMLQRIMELPEETRAVRPSRGSWRSAGWMPSATTSTTSTGRPKSPGRQSRPRRTCAPLRAPPAGRRTARSYGSWTPRDATSPRVGPAGSSSATRWPSRATRAGAARR
jgi:acyl-CoA synthetase (AMP-forming)/AMP-acid ligase II